MDIDQLRQLDAIATYGTISAAADELHMPQPTLSRSIRRLEQELGHDLLLREGRHVELSEAGRLALEYVRPILRDERLMRDALDRLAASANALRIGTVAPAPLWHMTAMLVERFPGILLSSETIAQREVERLLFNGTISMAISTSEMKFPAFCSCPLMHENLYVALPLDHPLAHSKAVTMSQLDGEMFLLFTTIGFWRELCDTMMPHSRFLVQEDREVFEQLLRTTPLPFFTTDAPRFDLDSIGHHHAVIPITDDAVHVTYHLVVRADATDKARKVFDWMAAQPIPSSADMSRVSSSRAV